MWALRLKLVWKCVLAGKLAIDYLKPHDRRTQYLRVAGKQTSSAPARTTATTNNQPRAKVEAMGRIRGGGEGGRMGSPIPGMLDRSLGDGGDNEENQVKLLHSSEAL
jgi:hypothetical protein